MLNSLAGAGRAIVAKLGLVITFSSAPLQIFFAR